MNPSAELLLSCRNLSCGYPTRKVLEDINFELKPGSSTVLLGPNGSGKSTLLKSLTKTIPPLAGEVTIEGNKLSDLSFSQLAQKVAYVPQEELPPFRFTVRQVVLMGRLPLSAGFFDTAADLEASELAMEEADCCSLADRAITEISGGERQRALIARALAQETDLLLLDEPTSHLDIGHQVAIIRLVQKLRDAGKALLTAMHDLNLAADLGETAILLNEGRIAMIAPIENVLASPILEKTYGVPFQRFRDDSGRLRVFGRTI